MHEVTIAKNILEIIQKQLAQNSLQSVKKIILEIGVLAAVDNEALKFGFNVISKNTVCDSAIIDILTIQAKANCDDCGKENNIAKYGDACFSCGSYALTIIQGEELRVKSMEVS